jgi:hypothetical protein
MRLNTDQAVVIVLDDGEMERIADGNCDLGTLEDMLMERLDSDDTGVLDGSECGPAGTTIFLYGADCEKLFASVEPVLKSYALCRNGRVMIRSGGPGAEQREIRLPGKSI